MHFKTALLKKYLNIALSKKCISKKHSKIAPSKNVFQNHMSNYPLKKMHFKIAINGLLGIEIKILLSEKH